MFFPDKLCLDSTTLVLLCVAAIPWLFPFLKSLTLPGGAIVEFREQLREVEKKVDVIEDRGLLPGRPESPQGDSQHLIPQRVAKEDQWNTDPNKGKFGGKPEANGRVLEAKIEPAAGPRSAACNILLSVRSTDDKRPLTGKVIFHLHPTFGNRKQYEVPVVDGVARDKITSWGVFTVGAVADEGKTNLELNLADVEGGTPKFYSQ
jgi:hypothetical protein